MSAEALEKKATLVWWTHALQVAAVAEEEMNILREKMEKTKNAILLSILLII